jgi:Bacterial RNA polymerase, alpha chain C terminal domain
MELKVVGWERNRGETTIAVLNLMAATQEEPRRSASRVFLKKEAPQKDEFEGVSIHFKASINLNSDYAARLKIDRREIARLFLMQYRDVSLKELLDLFEEIRRAELQGKIDRVDQLSISLRASSALENAGIDTIGSLVKMSETDLLELPQFDRRCLAQTREALESFGLHLKA